MKVMMKYCVRKVSQGGADGSTSRGEVMDSAELETSRLASWSAFILNLILSNPGALAFILRHHKRAHRMIENRTRSKYCVL